MKIPIVCLPQIPDEVWQLITKEPEDTISRILRENQIDMLEVLSNAESA